MKTLNFKVVVKDKFTEEVKEEYKPLTFQAAEKLMFKIALTLDFEKYFVERRSI